jgi:alginate O-acetyltransferase complex protein AlgI
MLFNSLHFFVFFIIVTSMYFALPYNKRWLLLLLSSCYFYMAFVPIYILILGFTIVIDYFAGIFIENAQGKRKRLFLICSLIANVGVLAIFKYFNFINENISFLLHGFALTNPIPYLKILLPIGLSFHTFQAMSYTIEVYRGNQKAERHFGIYSLYVMFYPQLVAGPIERPQNLLHQFREKYDFDYDRVTNGLKLMAWGLFKKVVIADRLAKVVDFVYNNPTQHDSMALIIATVFFAFQIYTDFSGYSDMAIGAARVMGFKLMKNFDRPFTSKSITELWRKWHISLSTWFSDYFFNPIAIKRRSWGNWGVVYASMITFLVLGMWHGANWVFIAFGAIHGIILSLEFLTKKSRKKIRKKMPEYVNIYVGILYTFSVFAFSEIFFRAKDLSTAVYISKKIFSDFSSSIKSLIHNRTFFENLGIEKKEFILSVLFIILLETLQYLQNEKKLLQVFQQKPTYIRWITYYSLILVILFLGIFNNRQFIYFQF